MRHVHVVVMLRSSSFVARRMCDVMAPFVMEAPFVTAPCGREGRSQDALGWPSGVGQPARRFGARRPSAVTMPSVEYGTF